MLKKLTRSLTTTIKQVWAVIRTILKVVISISIFMVLYWLGLKGVIGLVAGMAVMAYLTLSENMFLKTLIEMVEKKGDSRRVKRLKPKKIM